TRRVLIAVDADQVMPTVAAGVAPPPARLPHAWRPCPPTACIAPPTPQPLRTPCNRTQPAELRRNHSPISRLRPPGDLPEDLRHQGGPARRPARVRRRRVAALRHPGTRRCTAQGSGRSPGND